jgi:hypothetical protein
MKIKKVVVGLVASALVVASMATTVFAAKSPTTDKVTPTVAPSTSGGSSSSGSSQSSGGSSSSRSSSKSNAAVFASNISAEVIKYDGADTDVHAAVLKQLSDSVIASAKALGTGGILKAVDVKDSLKDKFQSSITIRFKSSAFKAGMKITVLHLPDGSSDWEKITPDSVSDGECVVTFTSLSPVVFTAEGVSDKTGETAPILPIAVVICLAGVVFFGTKIRFAK